MVLAIQAVLSICTAFFQGLQISPRKGLWPYWTGSHSLLSFSQGDDRLGSHLRPTLGEQRIVGGKSPELCRMEC